jgi:hypothetical protein
MKKEYIIYGGILILLFLVLNRFGLLGKKKKNVNQLTGFDTSTFKSNVAKYTIASYPKIISNDVATEYAQQIYDSKGIFKDKDSVVIDIFKKVTTKGDVAKIVIAFSEKYGQDVGEYLRFMDKDNYQLIFDYVKNMPSGFVMPSKAQIEASKTIEKQVLSAFGIGK